jgi:uncharacterized protein (TIGR02271 family)
MRELLVAMFDTETNATKAVRALEEGGVPNSSIRRYHKDDPAIPQLGPSPSAAASGGETYRPHQTTGGFWSWLLGEEYNDPAGAEYEQHHAVYNQAIESGNTVLVVSVEKTEAARVMMLLADQMPVQLDAADGASAGAGASIERTQQRDITGAGRTEERIPLAEEQLEIGKRKVAGATTVRRYVVEQPVERQVNLHDERVEVERRRVIGEQPATGTAFQERTVEVQTSHEEPVVSKTARVGEEVIVKKTGTDRTETVRDTVRKEQADVQNEPRSR